VSSKGPTYNVDIIVGDVPTRGLLNHRAQVTFGKQRVTASDKRETGEQCHSHNHPFDVRPIGASGRPLNWEQ